MFLLVKISPSVAASFVSNHQMLKHQQGAFVDVLDKQFVLLLFVVILLGVPILPGQAAVQCRVDVKTMAENIDGEVLVLSAGSLSYGGPHPAAPALTDAESCAATCGMLPGCNAWTFCSKQTGCGSGCKKWVSRYPKLTSGGPANPDPVGVDLPVMGFGAWTFPHTQNGCQYSFDTDNTSDAWPFGLCTLKRVPDPQNPKLYKKKAAAAVVSESSGGDGWISGTLSPTKDCIGLPANVCKQCGALKEPNSCLKCAKDPRAQYKKPIQYLLNKGNTAQNACSVCGGLADPSLRERCFDCILNNKRCATCVYGAQMWGFGKPNIGACLTCAAKKGDTYAGACNACAQSKAPGRCFSCLDTFPLQFCKPGLAVGTDGCKIGPNDQTPCDLCSNSALSDAVFKQCTACHMNSNWEQECLDCGSTPSTADDQARCYQCIQKTRFPSYQYAGCAACFSSWVKPGTAAACLGCVEDGATSYPAKASCSRCVDGSDPDKQLQTDTCFGCLKSDQKDYAAVCLNQAR